MSSSVLIIFFSCLSLADQTFHEVKGYTDLQAIKPLLLKEKLCDVNTIAKTKFNVHQLFRNQVLHSMPRNAAK